MKAKALALTFLVICGCEPARPAPIPAGPPLAAKPSLYSFGEVGQSQFTIDLGHLQIFEVKNNKTGKIYLFSFHSGTQGESQVKLDEWVEPVTGEPAR